jgi:hypothetical protein
MALVKPQAQPGFLAQATQVQAAGGWYAGNLVRWRTTLLEKMGGWRRLIDDALPSIIRRFHAWLDLDNRKNLLVATDTGVNLVVQDTLYGLGRASDLQGGFNPALGPTGATTFTVANGSTEVTVNTPVIANPGTSFFVRIPISIGGRILAAGTLFQVKAAVPGGFTFDMPMPALAAEAGTYGIPLLTNDIVNGFTVTWKAHGLSAGAPLRLTQETVLRVGVPGTWEEVNFAAPAGTLGVVATVVDVDHFTFLMGPYGTGDGLGGVTHQVYAGSSLGSAVTDRIGAVIGLGIQRPLGNPQRSTWFLGNMGQDGLVLASGGPLEVYKPPITNGPFLTVVGGGSPATAPQKSNGFIIGMPQAQVILFGSEPIMGTGVQDPLLIRWSDIGTYDSYTAAVDNQAGSYRLSRGARIVGAIQGPQAALILTDTDLWLMSYIGPPLIYGFTIMGEGCGLVAPHAIGVLGRIAVWQGLKNFWRFGDSSAQPVPCTVWDYIFEDIDTVNINKCHAAPNSTTNELAFYFPSKQTVFNVGDQDEGNLLLFSGDMSDFGGWSTTNAVVQSFSQLIETLYLYEPQYKAPGWYEDSGLMPISWFDRDLAAEIGDIIYAPDGTASAFLVSETAVDGAHSLSQSIIKVGERATYTLSVYAHDTSSRNLTLRGVSGQDGAYATFNTATGALLGYGVTSARFTVISAAMLPDDFGEGTATWRRYTLTFTSDDDQELEAFFNLGGPVLNYMGDVSKGIVLWGPQLVHGPDPLPYQETTGLPQQNETRRYVKVNMAENGAWDSGKLGRSAWLDVSIWGTPLGGDITPIGPPVEELLRPITPQPPRNLIQQHEIGHDDDGLPMIGVFAETGYTELSSGNIVMLVDQVHPDMKWFGRGGAVNVSLRAANYPQGPKHLYGPYSMTSSTQWFDPRVRARYVAVRYDWAPVLGFSARVGATTFNVKPAGRLP